MERRRPLAGLARRPAHRAGRRAGARPGRDARARRGSPRGRLHSDLGRAHADRRDHRRRSSRRRCSPTPGSGSATAATGRAHRRRDRRALARDARGVAAGRARRPPGGEHDADGARALRRRARARARATSDAARCSSSPTAARCGWSRPRRRRRSPASSRTSAASGSTSRTARSPTPSPSTRSPRRATPPSNESARSSAESAQIRAQSHYAAGVGRPTRITTRSRSRRLRVRDVHERLRAPPRTPGVDELRRQAASYASRVARPEPEEPELGARAGRQRASAAPRRRPTSAPAERESHDATAFYDRFEAPSSPTTTPSSRPTRSTNRSSTATRATWTRSSDGSVALVVTSPPYFAGKQYEEELERDGIPSSYVEYLAAAHRRVRRVQAQARTRWAHRGERRQPRTQAVPQPRGRRRSTSSRTSCICCCAARSCGARAKARPGTARGDRSAAPANPVLRDIDRARRDREQGPLRPRTSRAERERRGLPSQTRSTPTSSWRRPSTCGTSSPRARAVSRIRRRSRLGCPAGLIDLYTYENDLVLDPFMGSGSTLVAAARRNRRYVGYDLDANYVDIARRRVATKAAPPSRPPRQWQSRSRVRRRRSCSEAGFHDIETKSASRRPA